MSGNVKYTKNVTLAGKSLTLQSDISDEHLQNVYDYVNDKITDLTMNKKVSSHLLMGLMLGIEITEEFFIEKGKLLIKIKELEQTIIDQQKTFEHRAQTVAKLAEDKTKSVLDISKSKDLEIERLKTEHSSAKEFISEEANKTRELSKNLEIANLEIKRLTSEETNKTRELSGKLESANLEIKRLISEISELKQQHKNELEDYKYVVNDEIVGLDNEKNEMIENLKKSNFDKEKDIVKVVEENNKISEENILLRKRIEELMLIQNESEEYFGFGFDDELDDEELEDERDEVELKINGVFEKGLNIDEIERLEKVPSYEPKINGAFENEITMEQKHTQNVKGTNHKRKRRKGRK